MEAGELVIGRASDQDMVLIEDMVSRRHARVTLLPGQISIVDLGSRNGTFVNGEKVTAVHTLREGDRVLIGTSILKLISVPRAKGAPVDPRSSQAMLERTAAIEKTGVRSSVQGRLEEVPLVDLLQLLSTSKKTGSIVLQGTRGGRVHLRAGKLVSASIDADPTLPPRKAAYRMMAWTQGAFEFVPREEMPKMPQEIGDTTEQLLLEAMQQLDELRRGNLPSPSSTLALDMPLSPRLRDLTSEELDLVQLVHNYGTVQAVVDRAPATDLEVVKKLVSLVDRGYLRKP
jgi:hypothetical protein